MKNADYRVAIIAPQDYLAQIPSLMAAIRYMAQLGVGVDVVCGYDSRRPLPKFEGERVNLFPITIRPADNKTRRIPVVVRLIARGIESFKSQKYACVIGVDPQGLAAAYVVARVKRVPLVNLSLELSDSKCLATMRRRVWKFTERIVSHDAKLTLIQDWDRAAHIIQDNGIDAAQIRILPNSYMGKAHYKRSHYLHRKLGIPETQRIVLHAGLISHQMRCLELAEAAHSWSSDYVLVLHGRREEREEEYLSKLDLLIDGKRVIASLDLVPDDQIDEVFASAHVGTVFYRKDLGPNFTNIVGASGKLLMLLRCGVPVVTVDFPGLKCLTTRYRCGIAVDNEMHIAGALQAIAEDYDAYSTRSLHCYESEFDFVSHFHPILEEILSW